MRRAKVTPAARAVLRAFEAALYRDEPEPQPEAPPPAPSAWDRGDFLAHLREQDARLVELGFPPISPWWWEQLERFYGSPRRWRQFVARVGRRGGKSSTLCRVLVCEARFGDHHITPGDVGVVAIISASKPEARKRLRTITAILDALGIGHHPAEGGIELDDRPIAFLVYAATVAGVSGFTAIAVLCDEVAKWKDSDTGANPATQVLASVRPTMKTMPNARIFLISSPVTKVDAHAKAYDEGDNGFQIVAHAPTWVANQTITEESTHADEPDDSVWSREYAAIPEDGEVGSLIPATAIDATTRTVLVRGALPGCHDAAAIDPGTRRNAWTLAIAGKRRFEGRVVVCVLFVHEWRGKKSAPLKPDDVFLEMAAMLAPYHLHHVHTDHWSVDALAAVGRAERKVMVGAEEVSWPIYLMPWHQTSQERYLAYDTLRVLIERGVVELPPVPSVRSDLLAVRKVVTRNGLTVDLRETPDGRHADFAPAVQRAVERAAALPDPPELAVKATDEPFREEDESRRRKGPWWAQQGRRRRQ